MGDGRDLETGRELARNRRAANLLTGLDHDYVAPALGKIGRTHQTVVACANHNHPPRVSHRSNPPAPGWAYANP